ncbi:hypothetical protein GCM10017783_17780 [Deinococcus piscis]|uniref:Uncharacterized protein n=1 Tax=Deinococcus piscis TaxID=394230 RepID=A0ABQ3K6C9_9DEIO|nr:hypothetical protein [Deinococcus piscis]GHG05672.1 hypothetical protein GCM10017783_17780 [Deinococcus piscis]
MTTSPDALHLILTPAQWQTWLDSLCELPSGPAALAERPRGAEPVDAYTLSAYAEALQSAEVDGELWDTYRDLELEGASDDAQAWQEIKAFYQERGYVLLEVRTGDQDEPEEWIFAPELLRLLRLNDHL